MYDALEEIFRREAGRCIATLIRVLGDVDVAEDSVAEAFAIAAEQWPSRGVPTNPGAWITTTAHNCATDRLRRESTRAFRHLTAHRLHIENICPIPGTAPGRTARPPAHGAHHHLPDQYRRPYRHVRRQPHTRRTHPRRDPSRTRPQRTTN